MDDMEMVTAIQEGMETLSDKVDNLSTSTQDLKNTLATSIQNVLNVQLKDMKDEHVKQLSKNASELQTNKDAHERHLSELEKKYNEEISKYQTKVETLVTKLKTETQEAVEGSLETATDEIKKVIHENVIELNNATAKVAKSSGKNLLFNFACAIILTVAAICAYVYAQNYRDGTAIAEAKAVEALAAERAKFAKEMEDEKVAMEIEFSNREDKIREEAVESYKKTEQFREEACKEVALNIRYTNTEYYLYKYIRSTDLNEYSELNTFYNSFLKRGWNQYKKSQKK